MLDNVYLNCQSSVKLVKDKIIYVDPYKIDKELHDAHIIFITHDHYDHLDIESINKIKNDNTIIVLPGSISDKLDYENKYTIGPNNSYEILGIKFSTVPAYNTNKSFHKMSDRFVGYILNLDYKYYFMGDTDSLEENENLDVDICFVPIGGTYTMDYEEGAEFINKLKPKLAVPYHYSTIVGTKEDAEKFKELVDENIEVRIIMGEI